MKKIGQVAESIFQEKQERMIQSGLIKGLHHPDTVRLSQELDRLLNEQMKITSLS